MLLSGKLAFEQNDLMEERDSKTIALLGGSFNPPHVAHLLMASWALSAGGVDEVWVIPTGGHPFGKTLAPFEQRFEMCRLAFASLGDRVKILDVEREPRTHYSVETVEALAARYPQNQWRWIMGSDTLAQSAQWKDFDRLTQIASPLLIGRKGHPVQGQGGKEAVLTLPNVSSTLIREKIATHSESGLEGLIPGSVLRYIREHGLYESKK